MTPIRPQGFRRNKLLRRMGSYWQAYVFLLPTLIYFVVFHYAAMYGVQIAFKKFIAIRGIWGSPWVGFTHFQKLFTSYQFQIIFKNTVLLSVENLLIGFPIPILFALLVNQVHNQRLKRTIETVTYAPYFLSVIVVVSLMMVFTSIKSGLVNYFLTLIGQEPIYFMGSAKWFRPLYIITEVWQRTGWDSIIYIAALSSISPELHEAGMVDGASKLQRIWHIEIPSLLPTATTLFILRAGQIMKLGFEKAFIMQTPLNLDASEIISTYVYKIGVQQAQYSFASATDLFNSVINVVLIILVNELSKRLSDSSLF